MRTTLVWLERGLFAVGAGLAVWCAVILVEARFTKDLPVDPPLRVTQTLPDGEGKPQPTAAPMPAPAVGTVLARLELPRLNLSTAVLEGSDDATLSRGAGHIEDTPLPGEQGNVGIAGHRDTVFRALRRVKVGDEIDLRTGDRVVHYKIARTLIVRPEDVYVLDPTDQPTLTLVTCYPFEFIGHAPKRFIVQAVPGGNATK
jgi:LPXTG-site transpeptidase (sortase) family protein